MYSDNRIHIKERSDIFNMKVIKNINNNISLCIDSKGREVVAFGKGIGFKKPPYEIPLKKIERTFYNIKDTEYSVLKDIPVSIINASIRIVDEVEENLNKTLMSSTVITLADHIHFAIQRQTQNIFLEMTVQEDIKQLYSEEMAEGYKALKIIEEETGISLSKNEAGTIALHFINNQIKSKNDTKIVNEELIHACVNIIENKYKISINRNSFNYSRFVIHLDYLLKRTMKNKQIESENINMFNEFKEKYSYAYVCAIQINELFKINLNKDLSKEELLYLMLHCNRLCSRETISK